MSSQDAGRQIDTPLLRTHDGGVNHLLLLTSDVSGAQTLTALNSFRQFSCTANAQFTLPRAVDSSGCYWRILSQDDYYEITVSCAGTETNLNTNWQGGGIASTIFLLPPGQSITITGDGTRFHAQTSVSLNPAAGMSRSAEIAAAATQAMVSDTRYYTVDDFNSGDATWNLPKARVGAQLSVEFTVAPAGTDDIVINADQTAGDEDAFSVESRLIDANGAGAQQYVTPTAGDHILTITGDTNSLYGQGAVLYFWCETNNVWQVSSRPWIQGTGAAGAVVFST